MASEQPPKSSADSYGSFTDTKRARSDILEENFVKNSWFSSGLWQTPRLRKDWHTLHDEDDGRYSSLNTFFDVLFAITINTITLQLRNRQTLPEFYHWARYYGIMISLWLSTCEYSSRFDNDDVAHKIFWSLYGIGILGMLMHVRGDEWSSNSSVFSLCLGWVYILLGTHWFRCALAISRCFLFATVLGTAKLAFGFYRMKWRMFACVCSLCWRVRTLSLSSSSWLCKNWAQRRA
uniref:Uncharacterized protein n=1 Tax=Lotharella globosa TaxID=91324 RepID=A0A7S3YVA2_9EUKA